MTGCGIERSQGGCEDLAHSAGRSEQRSSPQCNERKLEESIRRNDPDSYDWSIEPPLGRVAHGVPHQVDRLRCLGNAVVPQQVYPILKGIAEIEKEKKGE